MPFLLSVVGKDLADRQCMGNKRKHTEGALLNVFESFTAALFLPQHLQLDGGSTRVLLGRVIGDQPGRICGESVSAPCS